jgi:flagellar hook-associated protein 2
MPDISVPGVKSRFDTDKTIENLMELERVPRKRIEKNVESLQTQKTTWQTLGRRITELRDSANQLYSYQNPFNDRAAQSSDPLVLDAVVTREARSQSYDFTVKQIAQADKFISNPLDKDYKAPAGTYRFSVGEDEKNTVSFSFSGGTLQDLSALINRRGQGKISSSVIAVKSGSSSLVIGSEITGVENRLRFEDEALELASAIGLVSKGKPKPQVIDIPAEPARGDMLNDGVHFEADSSLKVDAGSAASVALASGITPRASMLLRFETALSNNVNAQNADAAYAGAKAAYDAFLAARAAADAAEAAQTQGGGGQDDAPGEEITAGTGEAGEESAAGTEGAALADAGGAEEAAENGGEGASGEEGGALGEAEIAPEEPLPPPRVENLNILSLRLRDGSTVEVPAVPRSAKWAAQEYNLYELSGGKPVESIEIHNGNSHDDLAIRSIQIIDPTPPSTASAANTISTAGNALVLMDGIEIERPTNHIDDLLPGVTLNLRSASELPVNLQVENDTKLVKDTVINLVYSYNELMKELNVLTRTDERVINEISYLKEEERAEYKARLGTLAGDSSIQKLRSDLIAIANAPYQSAADGTVMLANFGISTDARRAGAGAGYDPSRLRGYLEINEGALDEAIASQFEGLRELMGRDTDGDLIIDSGVAFSLNRAVRPFVEVGGIIAGKTAGIDARVAADNRRIESIDRQLTRKEADLRRQYGQMEDAYNRMERMSNSLENFGAQNSPRNR